MKKLLVFLLLAITFQGFAQTNYITGINISLPSNPDANIEKWSSSMPPFMISAQTRLENGRVSPIVMESNILVSIRGGGVACGSFTKANAPASNFNATSKVWAGKAALDLLGTPCILKPGSYELCVQFFGEGAAGKTLIGEACKSFTVANVETEAKIYQPPQALTPADGTQFSDSDLKKPMTFRWTPVIPRPQEPLTYRLTVWQLMQGQTGTQAMHLNQPIITKDVDNMTQAVIYITGDFTFPQFIWNVQALNKEGKPIGENEGKSKPFQFSASACDVNLKLELKSIVCLPATHGFNNYKVCVSSTYTSSNYNLTYSGSNGFKAYAPSYSPFYTVSNITPALQIQNSGSTTTVNYCFDVSVPTGQTSIKVGLQGDDKDPGPMVCQPGAELDLRLPNCTNPTCDCGTWSPLTVLDAAQGKRYDCGSTIEWTCKQALNFTANYQCSPNDKTCEAKTTWEVKKGNIVIKSGTGTSQLNDGFSLLENGTYTLTLNASCNDKKCPPCTYTIIVRDCTNTTCDCGKWDNSGIKIQKNGAIISNVKCDGDVSLGIGTYGIQYPNFICNPNDKTCLASYSWSVLGPVTGNGTGNLINFNFSLAGTYIVTLTPFCGDKRCEPCKIVIKIEDPLPCNLSFTDNLKDKYCVGDQVTINWTGTPQPSTVNLVLIDFTNWTVYQTIATSIPNSGSYTWTLPANLPCDPERKWSFYVTDPAQSPQCWNYSKEFTIGCCIDKPCECGTWSSIMVNRLKYNCGNKEPIKLSCNKAIDFSNTYQCSPNDKTCVAETKWEVTKDGQSYGSGTGSNGTFTPTANGTYVLTTYANCNGKECKPCITTFIVEDCKPCDCGTWSSLTVQNASGIKSYPCGIKMVIPWSCNQAFNFTDSYQCSPNDRTCQAETKWEVKKGNIIISSGTGTNNLNGTFTPTENGLYTITLNAKCNGKSCTPCTYTISVEDCCQDSKIIIKKKNVVISNNGECLKSGVYTFINNLAPSTPIVNGTYVLTSTPNNVTVSTGNFTSGVPLNLTIPQYVCGSVTGFKLTYTWNRGKCSKTIERTICPPPCCDNITLKKTSKLLTGTDLNFTTEFSVSPSTTFTKVKVQILDINVSGAAKPWANILSLNETTWGSGTTNPAITTPGNAIWFNGSLTASGILTFNGKIINIYGSATTSTVNLIVRFTFYQNNGSCNEVICEKDISYNNVIGPR